MIASPTLTKVVWGAVIFLAFLGVAVASRRAVVLLRLGALTSSRNPAADLDEHFAKRRTITLLHVIPGALFMVLGPLQFIGGLRRRHPEVHRWSGRVFLTASAIIGVTGLTMAAGKTIGGWDEKSAIFLFGSFFLFALGKALWHAMRREFLTHREWMIRGYGVGLAVATIRPIMGIFFATAIVRGHTPHPQNFFGTAFWIGFTLQAIVAEIWIRYTRSSAAERRTEFSVPLHARRSWETPTYE
jgi:uncharacterized membrane protein